MSPVPRTIERLGGLRALAKALGHRNCTTVQGWKERGVIPSRQIAAVIKVGLSCGIELGLTDFIPAADIDREAA